MKLKTIIIFLSIIIIASCKKKSANVSGSLDVQVVTGVLQLSQNYTVSGTAVSAPTRSVYAIFCNKNPIDQYGQQYYPFDFVKIDSLKLNSTKLQLKLSNPTFVYYDSLSIQTFPPAVWKVYGWQSTPNFTITSNDSIPRFTKAGMLPDSASVSQGVTVPLGSVNADKINIDVWDGVSLGHCLNVTKDASTAVFNASSMYPAVTNVYGKLTITCYKTVRVSSNGRFINLAYNAIYTKTIKIVP